MTNSNRQVFGIKNHIRLITNIVAFCVASLQPFKQIKNAVRELQRTTFAFTHDVLRIQPYFTSNTRCTSCDHGAGFPAR